MMTLADKARIVAYLSFVVVLGTQLIELWTSAAPWVVWIGLLLPLLVFVPGILRDNLRSYIWLCFVLLLYFMRLVLALFADPDSPRALTGMVAVVALFVAAMMYVRWRARELRQAGAPVPAGGDQKP